MATFTNKDDGSDVVAMRISATVLVCRGPTQASFVPGDWLVISDIDKPKQLYGFIGDERFRETFYPKDTAAMCMWRVLYIVDDRVGDEGRTRRIEL